MIEDPENFRAAKLLTDRDRESQVVEARQSICRLSGYSAKYEIADGRRCEYRRGRWALASYRHGEAILPIDRGTPYSVQYCHTGRPEACRAGRCYSRCLRDRRSSVSAASAALALVGP